MALIEDFRHHLKDFGPLSATFTAFVIWYLSRIVYRLFFHPLANVPGPKLAAATSWYEFYYDVVKNGGGQYNWSKIGQLHEQYGLHIPAREVTMPNSASRSNHTDQPSGGPYQGLLILRQPALHVSETVQGLPILLTHEPRLGRSDSS